MGHCAARFQSDMRQFYDFVSDPITMIWQSSNQAFVRAEVICPQPRRALRVPTFMEGFNKIDHKPKSFLPKYKEGSAFEVLDVIQNKDDQDNDFYEANQTGFFCGSPPVRSCNTIVHDARFSKPIQSLLPTLAVSTGKPKLSVSVDGGSSTWGSISGSPKVRIEGFACGKSDPPHVVHALA